MTPPGGSQHAPAIGPREEEDGRDASIMQTRRIKPLLGGEIKHLGEVAENEESF